VTQSLPAAPLKERCQPHEWNARPRKNGARCTAGAASEWR
jgi:hypothetical protein